MADKKLGFGGQWIDLFKTGRHVGFDDKGKKTTVDVTPDFLKAVSDNYDPTLHEAPACIGHPESDAPAYGWVSGMRVDGEMLQAQFMDTDPGFEQIVNEGRYKKRSPKFYLDDQGCGKFPYLRHVAWLGAQPPAVKGMKDVQRHAQFSEDEGTTVAFEIEFSEGEEVMTTDNKIDDKKVEGAVTKFLKDKLGLGKDEAPATASFSEDDRKKLIADATAAASAAFSEELKKRDTTIEALQKQVDSQAGSSKRGEIVSFCEDLERRAILPPSFRRNGGVEFMELLAAMPADKRVATIEFAEEGGKQVEKKVETPALDYFKAFLSAHPAYIQFGEQFDKLQATGDGAEIIDPKRMDEMRDAAGIVKPAA